MALEILVAFPRFGKTDAVVAAVIGGAVRHLLASHRCPAAESLNTVPVVGAGSRGLTRDGVRGADVVYALAVSAALATGDAIQADGHTAPRRAGVTWCAVPHLLAWSVYGAGAPSVDAVVAGVLAVAAGAAPVAAPHHLQTLPVRWAAVGADRVRSDGLTLPSFVLSLGGKAGCGGEEPSREQGQVLVLTERRWRLQVRWDLREEGEVLGLAACVLVNHEAGETYAVDTPRLRVVDDVQEVGGERAQGLPASPWGLRWGQGCLRMCRA